LTQPARPAERVVAFYNQRGTAEQCIKEGKGAIKWTRLSCHSLAANAVRLQLHVLAYNLGKFHADTRDAQGGEAVVADQPAGEADQSMTSSKSTCRSYSASWCPENRIGPQPYCSSRFGPETISGAWNHLRRAPLVHLVNPLAGQIG